MARIRPGIRETETFSETNFLRLQTSAAGGAVGPTTLEHFCFAPGDDDASGNWSCTTIIDAEPMSRQDALFIATSYARENDIPVIYSLPLTAKR